MSDVSFEHNDLMDVNENFLFLIDQQKLMETGNEGFSIQKRG